MRNSEERCTVWIVNRGIQNVSPWGKSRALIFVVEHLWIANQHAIHLCRPPSPSSSFFVLVWEFSFSSRFLSLSLAQSLNPVRTILFHDHISFHLLPRQFFVFDPVFFLGVVICLILQVEFFHFCSLHILHSFLAYLCAFPFQFPFGRCAFLNCCTKWYTIKINFISYRLRK